MTPSRSRPLIVTSDPVLLDELLRLCAAAGSEPLVAADAAALRRSWADAPLVLLGGSLADAAAGLPRRQAVVVVGAEGEPLWEKAATIGAAQVAVLPSANAWLLGLLSEPLAAPAAGAPVLAVVGGVGGGGATTLAVALARCASAAGTRTLLVDADPFGGGIDLALGWEAAAGHRWPQLVGEGTRIETAFGQLPERSGLRVLAGDREQETAVPATTMRGLLEAAASQHGLVVADLPRSVDGAAQAVLAVATAVYVVVPAQVRAVAAARQLAAQLHKWNEQLSLIVRGPSPGGLSAEAVSRAVGVPLGAALRSEPGLCGDYERGIPPGQPRGPLSRLCTQLLRRHLGERGSGQPPQRGRSAA